MAYILATVLELLGAVLIGYNVTDTLRNKVVDSEVYINAPGELMLGQLAVLGGIYVAPHGSLLLLGLDFLSLHRLVGGILGFTLLMRGTRGIHWNKVLEIVASWIISPVLAGFISMVLYIIIDFSVLRRKNPIACGLVVLPIFYFFCFAFNTFMVVYQGSKVLGLHNIPFWLALIISICSGSIAAIVFQFIIRPRVIAWIDEGNKTKETRPNETEMATISSGQQINAQSLHPPEKTKQTREKVVSTSFSFKQRTDESTHFPAQITPTMATQNETTLRLYSAKVSPIQHESLSSPSLPRHSAPKALLNWLLPDRNRKEDQQTLRMFSTIQVLTGCFSVFTEGAMDVAQIVVPILTLLTIYREGIVEMKAETPLWIIVYGVSGPCVGFWTIGHRVMRTIGKRVTEINPCSGFTIEFGAAFTVLVASKLGIPISTAHCIIGSVVAVGSIKPSGDGIDWKVCREIVLAWLITLPASALLSAIIMFIFKQFLLK